MEAHFVPAMARYATRRPDEVWRQAALGIKKRPRYCTPRLGRGAPAPVAEALCPSCRRGMGPTIHPRSA